MGLRASNSIKSDTRGHLLLAPDIFQPDRFFRGTCNSECRLVWRLSKLRFSWRRKDLHRANIRKIRAMSRSLWITFAVKSNFIQSSRRRENAWESITRAVHGVRFQEDGLNLLNQRYELSLYIYILLLYYTHHILIILLKIRILSRRTNIFSTVWRENILATHELKRRRYRSRLRFPISGCETLLEFAINTPLRQNWNRPAIPLKRERKRER